MSGWDVESTLEGGLISRRAGRVERANAAPSLVDFSVIQAEFPSAHVFTAFEIQKDFSACIAKFPV
jgi:hypothetical protein